MFRGREEAELGGRGPAVGLGFEVAEDGGGAADDGGGQAGHFGDVDAEAAVGGAGHDTAEEDHLAVLLDGGGVEVVDAGEQIGHGGELVVVGGEDGAGAQARVVVQVLDDGAGDGDAVVGAGAAADFVEDDEAAGGGLGEDGGELQHLDHEGAGAGGEVVVGADAGEDAVDDADGGAGGGDEAADLGHEDDQGDLAEVGGLAGHVGAGEDGDLALGGVQERVVGDEAFVLGELDDGVAAGFDLEGVAFGLARDGRRPGARPLRRGRRPRRARPGPGRCAGGRGRRR